MRAFGVSAMPSCGAVHAADRSEVHWLTTGLALILIRGTDVARVVLPY